MYNLGVLAFSLIAIAVSSSLFCNALEFIASRLNLSQGVTGSILAAVATALPETLIPIIAIITGHNRDTDSSVVSIGAILGAPLMLSTFALFVMAVSVIKKRGLSGRIKPELSGFKRDLVFFLVCYILAFAVAFVPVTSLRVYMNYCVAVILITLYGSYLFLTIRASKSMVDAGHVTESPDRLTLAIFGLQDNFALSIVQLFLALLILVYSAHAFIVAIEHTAKLYEVSLFVLSLFIIPIASELPEKINSTIWVRSDKDTLAVGNITGALVFQGSVLPAIGIMFTNWQITDYVHIVSIGITCLAALWLCAIACYGRIRIWHLFINGGLYLANIIILLSVG